MSANRVFAVGDAGLIGKCEATGFQYLQRFHSAVNKQPVFLEANAAMIDV